MAATRRASMLRNFVKRLLDNYNDDRNHPDLEATSHLSPYLHFGHLSAHEIFWSLMQHCHWSPDKLSKPNGSIEGFWNVGPAAEAFLDQLCTWREIGFNMCQRESNYDRYESLPAWALKTLADHESDPRPKLYSFEELESKGELTIDCGTLRRSSWFARVAFTITCACCGASAFSNGRPTPR